MGQAVYATGDQLTHALRELGVNFILGGTAKIENLQPQPASLIAALANSDEARLRLSLVPLFLEHPEFAEYAQNAAELLEPQARITLQCYFSAALWLGQIYCTPKISLPDLFSDELKLSPGIDPEINLHALAHRHGELTGMQINWLGTYKHAAQVWLASLEFDRG